MAIFVTESNNKFPLTLSIYGANIFFTSIRDDEGVDVVSDNVYKAIILMEDPKRVFTVDVYDYAEHDIIEAMNLIYLLKDAFRDGKVVSRVRSFVNDHGLVEFHAYNWKYDSGIII